MMRNFDLSVQKPRLLKEKNNHTNLTITFDHNLSKVIGITPKEQIKRITDECLFHDYAKRENMRKLYRDMVNSQTRPNLISLNSNILFLKNCQDTDQGQYSTYQIPAKEQISVRKKPILEQEQHRFYQFLKELDSNLQTLIAFLQVKDGRTSAIKINQSFSEYFLSICSILDQNPYYFHKMQLEILQSILDKLYNSQALLAEKRARESVCISQSGFRQRKENRKIRFSKVQVSVKPSSGQNDGSKLLGSNPRNHHHFSGQSNSDSTSEFILAFQKTSLIDYQFVIKTIEYRYERKGIRDQNITQRLTILNIQRQIQNVSYVGNLEGLIYMLKYHFKDKELPNLPIIKDREQEQLKIYFQYYCEKGATQFHDFLSKENRPKLTKIQLYNFIMSFYYGIRELQKHKIIHQDLQICNFVQIEELYKIIDYKKIICLNGGQEIKKIYHEIFELLLQSENIQDFLLDEMNKEKPKYLKIYNDYWKRRNNIEVVNNPQKNEQNQLIQQAIKKFFEVFEGNMDLKHYQQFYNIITDRLLKKGKRKTGFPLSANEIQCIISLFPKIEDVISDIKLLNQFKQNFIASLQQIQKKCINQSRINRKQLRRRQHQKKMYKEKQHEQNHEQNIQKKNNLMKRLLGKQFLDRYCYLQQSQPNQALPAKYQAVQYITLSQNPHLTQKYVLEVINILQELQKKGMMQLHADQKTYIFDSTQLKLNSLSYIYKIKKMHQQKNQQQLQKQASIASYNTFIHALLLLNSENRRPFLNLAEKIQKCRGFNKQIFQKIANQNLSSIHGNIIFHIFNSIYSLAVNQNIRQTTSSIQQDKDGKYDKFNIIKAAVNTCTVINPNNYLAIKQKIQILKRQKRSHR